MGCRDGGAQCSLEAATLAVLDCLFAAAEAAPPARDVPAHTALTAQHSIAANDVAAAAPGLHQAASDGIVRGGHGSSARQPVVAASGCYRPELAEQHSSRDASARTAAQSIADPEHSATDPASERRLVEVRLLVTHFVAGLLVGTAAGPGRAMHVRVVAIPGRRDETALVVSGCLPAVKQEVARIVGVPAQPT